MSLAVSCAIIGIALVATMVAVTVVLGGDMLRREWLRKRRWKRLEREAEERRIATASVSTGLAMTEEETE